MPNIPFQPLAREHATELVFAVVGSTFWALYPNMPEGEPDKMIKAPASPDELFQYSIGAIATYVEAAKDATTIEGAIDLMSEHYGFPTGAINPCDIDPKTGTYKGREDEEGYKDPDLYPIAEANLKNLIVLVYAYGLIAVMDKADPLNYKMVRMD